MNRQKAQERAKHLVSKMTIEEKISQMRFNAPAVERLGIPAYNWWGEALHGVARAGQATSFPQAIALGAAFDPELMGQIGNVIADEARAKYNAFVAFGDRDIYKGLTLWSPNVNIFRDPRWGRGQETYGEDPCLTGTLGSAFVRGIQGDGEYMKAAACAKHFAVHSGPEALRHSIDVKASEKDMWETYLPAFEMLVKDAKVEGVMGTYNRMNSLPTSGNPYLIRTILRDMWGFEGYYTSDCWAIRDFHEGHGVTKTPQESAAMAVNAGCELNCGDTFLYLYDAWKEGLVSEEVITEAVTHLFTTRFLLGLFDETEFDDIPYTVVECPAHLALAEKAAEKSIVLLKNDGILPLDRGKIKTIGVIGPNADSRTCLIGNYHGTAGEKITVLEGIRRLAGDGIRIMYSEGSDIQKDRIEHLAFENDRISEAMVVADNSDVIVLAVGLNEHLEGEEGDTGNSAASGDKADLLLPAPQRALMEAMAQTGKPVILCLLAGSPIDLSFADENFCAVLTAWYPGARGGLSLARILFGDVSPSGKLPISFIRNDDPLPAFTDYSMKGRTYRYLEKEPLYPFGYGLSYADIAVTGMAFEEEDQDGRPGKIRVSWENRSAVPSEDVVQVYMKAEDNPDAVPNPGLCAFGRISSNGSDAGELILCPAPHSFEVVNERGERIPAAGKFTVYAGTGQPDGRTEELTGKKAVKGTLEIR